MKIGSFPIFQPRQLELHNLTRLGEPTPGIAAAGTLQPAEGIGATPSVGPAAKSSFGNILQNAIAEVDGKMRGAAAEQAKVLTGETNNLHQAMIAMQEASTAFSLMVEVRNKLVESYQEIMRMQV